jgi:predicted RNA-binding Zn ribbon-like protein
MSAFQPRFPVTPAPDGLVLVQELLNTRSIRGKADDLLADAATAGEWASRTLPEWSARTGIPSPRLRIGTVELERLRALRRHIDEAMRDGATPVAESSIGLRLDSAPDGTLRLVPDGVGIEWMAAAVWSEVFAAQQVDRWKRLKLCKNVECSSAFYDRSKNNSGVWHDVHTCGNTANLKASRARKARSAPVP